jgi:1,4-alpha-glucan branching enzyme
MVGLAAAAALVGFVVRGAWTPNDRAAPDSVATTAAARQPTQVRAASANERESMPVPQQFVFNYRGAHRVALVGDFNRWDPNSAPMNRSPDGEMWSVTLPIAPGRHMYGFMIDDSLFMLDPRMPKARDPDLGAEGSIVLVVRP